MTSGPGPFTLVGRGLSKRVREPWLPIPIVWTIRLAVLAEYGNMSSPTVLFILDRLRRRRSGVARVLPWRLDRVLPLKRHY